MIANFSREFIGDEPDWNRLHIIHAWGTYSEEGIYSIAVRKVGLTPLNYTNAKSKYGQMGHSRVFAEKRYVLLVIRLMKNMMLF